MRSRSFAWADNYSAEYGRSAGAIVNVSIRSGTNKFHGKAYDYIRNTVFNAIGPFTPPSNPLTGAPQKPILIRNQFGGTFGGPIFKDKLFFLRTMRHWADRACGERCYRADRN